MGNFSSASDVGSAEAFVEDQARRIRAPVPAEPFHKGDLKGLLHAKLDSKVSRDKFVDVMRKEQVKHNDSSICVGIARSLEEQAKRGFLFGLKKLMIDSWASTTQPT